jgi:SAM-dependent methyltransferase
MKDCPKQQQGWDVRYRTGQTGWDRGEVNPVLPDWLQAVDVCDRRVLVPGCGRGHEVVELARRGARVTAVDIAPTALDALGRDLEARGLDADVVECDLFAWQPGEPFDVVYEQTSLCAHPPRLWEEYAHRVARWTRSGGLMMALFMQTGTAGGPPWHCDPLAMQRLFRPVDWRWPAQVPVRVPHPAGFHELAYVLERRDARWETLI